MARILVVEDDPDVRPLLVEVLTEADHQVDAAAGVRDGLALLGARGYDLVLADSRLPDGFGSRVADAARARGVGTLILTGLSPEQDGGHEVLLKPIRPDELVAAVRRALAEAAGRREENPPAAAGR